MFTVTIILRRSCPSASHTHTHTRMSASHTCADLPRQRTQESVFHSSSVLSFPFLPRTDVPRDLVFSPSSPSSRSGFELYYFLLVDSFPRGASERKQKIKRKNNLSIQDSSRADSKQGVLGSPREYEHILDPFHAAQAGRQAASVVSS